jgi:hypothetical protein
MGRVCSTHGGNENADNLIEEPKGAPERRKEDDTKTILETPMVSCGIESAG